MAAAITFTLAGCGRGGTPPDTHSSTAAAEPVPTPASPSKSAPASLASSDYTDLALDKCKVTYRSAEFEATDWTCPGRGGIPLFVRLGDGRMDLAAGAPRTAFAGLSAFNDIGGRIEWRLVRGRPVAVIFRYRDATEPGRAAGRTVLAVEKIGQKGAPGCRIAQVGGGVTDANTRARELADAAPRFACSRDSAVYLGDAR